MGLFSSSKLSEADKAKIDEQMKSSHVFIASKTYCPYCKRAKQILEDAGVDDAVIIELDDDTNGSAVQEYLKEVTGQRTVPNIFINGKHIGGCTEIVDLKSSGQLKSLL